MFREAEKPFSYNSNLFKNKPLKWKAARLAKTNSRLFWKGRGDMTMKNRKLQLKIKPGVLRAPPTPLLPSFPFPSMLFHGYSSLSLSFTHLQPHHKMCQRVNLHTPDLHSTLMLSQDKLCSLSLISNLLLLLFPFSLFLSFTQNELVSPEAIQLPWKTSTYPELWLWHTVYWHQQALPRNFSIYIYMSSVKRSSQKHIHLHALTCTNHPNERDSLYTAFSC